MNAPLSPQSDQQWADLLMHQETLERAKLDAEVKMHQQDAEARTKQLVSRRRLTGTIVFAGSITFAVAFFFSVMALFISQDLKHDEQMSKDCIAVGRVWSPAENICYPTGEKPGEKPEKETR